MSALMDYSKMPLEELMAAEKEHKKKSIISSFIIGFLVGIMIFGIASKGFGIIYTVIPIFLIMVIYRASIPNSTHLKSIREELMHRQ